jgi:cilia- and flagella-associated protein 251
MSSEQENSKMEEKTDSPAPPSAALQLSWAFGFNKDILSGVHNLSDDTRSAIFYVSAHSAVIYDYVSRRQQLLQGHCNPITTCCVSEDKRWIATADAGADALIVVWDSITGTPIKTIFNPHPNGILAMDITPDAMFIVTISVPNEVGIQEIALWEWTSERDEPLYRENVGTADIQTSVRFNPSDVREIVSNGASRVTFWNWDEKKFKYYSPPLSKRDFPNAGAFTQSIFIPDTKQAVTATKEGNIVLWDCSLIGVSENFGRPSDRKAVKMLTMGKGGINYMKALDEYLVFAGDDGAVRFYDYQFRIIAWFEDLDAGPVTSVSFANLPAPPATDVDGFTVPDFIVGTSKALIVGVEAAVFAELKADRRRGTLLAQGFDAPIAGVAVHPQVSQMAVVTTVGTLALWDFVEKRLLNVRVLDVNKATPKFMVFDPSCTYLAIGYTNGSLKLINAQTFEDTKLGDFKNSLGEITNIRFSAEGDLMATADDDRCVALYKYTTDKQVLLSESTGDDEIEDLASINGGWIYIGKSRSHSKKISGLEFGVSQDGRPLLMSIGEDKVMVEYDLDNTSVLDGLQKRGNTTVTEQIAYPSACMWHPRVPGSSEDLFVTANSEYKIKIWNGTNKTCRKTVLGPTYGGPITKMARKPTRPGVVEGTEEYIAYSTAYKVVGLMKIPFDGNPTRAMGLVAHPSEVQEILFSNDGEWLVTCGGQDMTVNLWKVDTNVIEKSVSDGGIGVTPFVPLIEGGRNGEFYQDMIDFFYYAQIRAQGEQATERRTTENGVPLDEIPNLMRALGYYPSEKEIENMVGEVKYARFLEDGTTQEEIGFDDFLKLYVNHRPVYGVGKQQIQEAFEVLADKLGRRGGMDGDGPAVSWNALQNLLQDEGEQMSKDELDSCLQSLLGDGIEDIGGSIGPLTFSNEVLGFEDYDE